MEKIIIKGAREHNLKNISVKIPKNKLVVFTGVSGSGKSSLAFDTIYAEGQRRYVESLSAYARQFLGIMAKPDVDTIEGLSPSVSIDQKSTSHNPRSTVGTVTEIYDYLRLLFARIGHPHCPNCAKEILPMDKEQILTSIFGIIEALLNKEGGRKPLRFLVLSPVVRDRKGEFSGLLANLKAKGFTQARIDGKIFNLEEELFLIKTNRHSIETIIDRLTCSKKQFKDQVSSANLKSRLADSLEQALELSDGLVILSQVKDASFDFPVKPQEMKDYLFSEKLACPDCNVSLPEIEPRSFSFNSPHGACSLCKGLGNLLRVDETLVINPNLSIAEGGILPFAKQFYHDTWFSRLVITVAEKYGIDSQKPLLRASRQQKKVLLFGTGDKEHRVEGKNRFGRLTEIFETFKGVVPELERRYGESSSDYVLSEIEKYMRSEVCQQCQGGRLRKEALGITIKEKSIVDINRLSIKEALKWINKLQETNSHTEDVGKKATFSQREKTIASPILKEVKKRLEFLLSVGLDYLTLERSASSLAGGEAQRIRLASQIGSGLSGVLYVLDEPSIGLHPRDNNRLINTLKKLRDLGNTVVVVEHDRDMIESADFILDFGPGGGKHGGAIVGQGSVNKIKSNKNSLTGQYLTGKKRIQLSKLKMSNESQNPNSEFKINSILKITGCSQFNLKNIDVVFPLNKLICITGVSGSGKSTLIVETLYHALKQHFNPYYRQKPGPFKQLQGTENVKAVYLIDQSPIGKTPRSNPATYVGAFTYIRQLYAALKESKLRGYKMGRFSFNVKGGRCENCQGQGEEKIEMQFLPPVWVKCEVCAGDRYNRSTLEVEFKGKNITEALEMTVAEARDFFQNIPGLYTKLATLNAVGLSYIKLGQPAPTLSGGEAQRVKLAEELCKKGASSNLYLLDEPTTGLHFADLEKLLKVLYDLVSKKNTVIVIEHNLEIIKNADYIIDLGPQGGKEGGRVIAQGKPYEIAKNNNSYTGAFLRKAL